jgi:hypothetical protein
MSPVGLQTFSQSHRRRMVRLTYINSGNFFSLMLV